jgi:hypothetical protein
MMYKFYCTLNYWDVCFYLNTKIIFGFEEKFT